MDLAHKAASGAHFVSEAYTAQEMGQPLTRQIIDTDGPSNINDNFDSYTGTITATDCQIYLDRSNAANFVGCKFENPDQNTWDTYSGGVWASQWTSDRIKIWYWPYGSVPADVLAGTPMPGTTAWGTPRSSVSLHNTDLRERPRC